MKHMGWGVALVVCWGLWTCNAEASQFSHGISTAWGYLFSPVNAVANLVADLSVCLTSTATHFIQTVISNANPGNVLP